MARFLVGAAIGALVTLVAGAALGIHAQDDDQVTDVVADPTDAVLDCIQWAESRDDPGAKNPRSGAQGLFQFLPSTWRGTPQGRAGLSPFDPWAARAAARWMLDVGRGREFATYWGCR